MSHKQANSNSVEGSASQQNQQQDAINLSISKVPVEFAEAQQTQQNQQGDLIDLNAPEVQTVQEGSQHPQRKVDDLLCTDNQSLQQRQQKNEFFKLLKKSVEGFADWPAQKQILAVFAVGAIVSTALPILAIALPLAATGAVVSLTLFFAVKAVSYAFQGLKWSGEKAVKGLGYVANGTVKGAKKGYEHSMDSLKRCTSFIEEKTKEKASSMLVTAANKLYNAAGTENYGDKLDALTEEQRELSHDIRKDLKKIFDDKGNNTDVINNILSEIKSKIDSKITSTEAKSFTVSVDDYVNNITLITKWKEQKKFINNLDEDSLHRLLTQRTVPKTKYMLNSTFSEHHDEIKEVIKQCKEDHYLRSQEKQERKAKRSSSLPLPESKSSSVQSTSSLPESGSLNSLNSVSTDGSSAELLSPTEHKKAKRSFFSFSTIGKAAKEKAPEVGYQPFSESSPVKTATIRAKPAENRVLTQVPVPTAPNVAGPPKPHRDRSNSLSSGVSNASSLSANSRLSGSKSTDSFGSYNRNSDSGVSSADSSPRHSGPQVEVKPDELKNLRLNRRGSLNNGVFKPSTQVTVHTEVHQHDTIPKLVS